MNREQRIRLVAGLVVFVLVLAIVGGLLAGTGGDDGGPTASTLANGLTVTDQTSELGPPVTTRFSDLPTVTPSALPEEAVATAGLVLQAQAMEEAGQDTSDLFPYPQDGAVFQNREGLLPAEEPGYYREYTVPTPGSEDRGARRLVVGRDGGIYYTEDHYESFREVVG